MGRNSRSRRTVQLSLLAALTLNVCLADSPFSDAAQNAATAKTVNGDVSVLRDERLLALIQGDQVKVKETIVTGLDGHALFAVADGSTFEVFPNSRVIFRNNPPAWSDFLDIMLGRVRVKIEHIGKKPNNNKVYTPPAVISVRGTIFDITVNGDEVTTVEVEEGIVGVRHLLLPTSRTDVELKAGDAPLRIYPNEPIAKGGKAPGVLRQVVRMGIDALIVATRPRSVGTIGGGVGGGIPGGGGGGVGDETGGSGPPASGPGAPGPGAPPPAAGPGAPPPPAQ